MLLGIIFNFVDNRASKVSSASTKHDSLANTAASKESTLTATVPSYAGSIPVSPYHVSMPIAYPAPSYGPPVYPPPTVQTPPSYPSASPPASAANLQEKEANPSTQAFANQNKSYNPKPKVRVVVARENPKLFQKEAHLYIDRSGSNAYMGEDTVFSLRDVSGIRRNGAGIFSYDGFAFYFDCEQANYRYAIENLNHIAFYPNCVVLVPRDEEYPALLFTDETKSIRKALETFKIDNE